MYVPQLINTVSIWQSYHGKFDQRLREEKNTNNISHEINQKSQTNNCK